jgi:alkylhydroperoxidase family enzyme
MLPFQNYTTRESSLSPRHREILILRTGWLFGNEYVWTEHAAIARKAGLTADELRRIAQGPDARGWDPFEATLLRAADELYRDSFVSDRTWAALAARFDNVMMMNALITASNYRMVSMALNALGVQIDPEEPERFPKLQLR